ncbi:MAG: TIGR02452 family protein [Anaerolineae bacterium]|nr:TIGR02452 family protein [Anaerolineae bacterium]
MSLKTVATETLAILENGRYVTDSGDTVQFLPEQQTAVAGTRLYTPEELHTLLVNQAGCQRAEQASATGLVMEVTGETTQVAAHRLTHSEGCKELVLLNYASARNPGGGFITGAKAQEEDLARCSGLYPCLLTQPGYYEANRKQSSLLYTDHIIYSPDVPFFRTHSSNLLPEIFLASVITAPAPNAGEVLRREPEAQPLIAQTLRRRAGMVLAVARENGHRSVLLGAWGCGVFRNDPPLVADIFGNWLISPDFSNCFDRVVFAVYDLRQDKGVFTAFKARLAG